MDEFYKLNFGFKILVLCINILDLESLLKRWHQWLVAEVVTTI